jgi:hypothetical protein
MSVDAHPNIHAAGLAVDIMQAIRKRLRGKAAEDTYGKATEAVTEEIATFCVRVSCLLDERYGT